MADLSRRSFFFGGFLKELVPERATDEKGKADVTDLLARSRNRAPWEKATRPPDPTGQIARVLTFDCLVTMGSGCTSCIERCPEQGALVTNGVTAPSIDPSLCTGCGDCVLACPAPRPAIAMGPKT